jgi:vacuolar-type H+-ATPase subunit I/STV1
VPLGTINRIKAGDYMDCKYSTIKAMLIALIGGTTDEFPCNEQVDKELQHMAALEKQNERLSVLAKENEELKDRLAHLDEQHRSDIRTVREEYQEQIADYRERVAFLKDELKAWRALQQK